MAARAIWKGYLKLSLVSCAVALYPAASSSSRVRFNTLNRKTGNRVKRQFVDSVTEEPVESEDQVKGYPVAKNEFVLVEDEEIEALKLESTHTIDIETFVPRSEVDERYLDTPYYLAPDDAVAQEAYAVIRDAVREKKMAAIGRVVMARRERLLLIEPLENGLIGTTLHYANEIRDEGTVFDEIPKVDYPREVRDLAMHIVDTKAGHFEPETFEDRYEKALVDMLQAKASGGREAPKPDAPRPSNVVNLMDALKRSLAAEKTGPEKDEEIPATKPARAASSARRKAAEPKAAAAKAPAKGKSGEGGKPPASKGKTASKGASKAPAKSAPKRKAG
ncbi:Ku protein [Salinarimonas sp.]|uniref:non-homologous end joining protein Ku n=1 Tax=Salinarimonas sp. TaxID=2766526 RepID=UPI003919519B